MNTYEERINYIGETLAPDVDLHELTELTNESMGLHFEIEMELLDQEVPPSR